MNLKEFLFYNQLTVKDFANLIEMDKCYLSSVLNGNRKPSQKMLRAIERASKGIVKKENAFIPIKIPKEILNERT
jgi:transcriptional regulator with XRE-family HTH domain